PPRSCPTSRTSHRPAWSQPPASRSSAKRPEPEALAQPTRHVSGTVVVASIALVLIGLADCAGSPPSVGLIDVEAAKTAAARATTSSVPLSVTSASLSTYGREAGGGKVAPAGTPVCAIEVFGSFPVP